MVEVNEKAEFEHVVVRYSGDEERHARLDDPESAVHQLRRQKECGVRCGMMRPANLLRERRPAKK